MSQDFYELAADKFVFRVKKGLLYSRDDVWVESGTSVLKIGITDFFQRRGGDIVFLQLPKVGDKVERDGVAASFETIKVVLDVLSPFSGFVSEVNAGLVSKPETMNNDPYGEGWLLKIEPSNEKGDEEKLLSPEGYLELMKRKVGEELRKIKGG